MNRCPTPVELERAYWTQGDAARVHALACARCTAELAEIESLVAAGRAIEPAPQSAERREEIRTTLLAGQPVKKVERRFLRWWQLAPVAAAAAAAVLWFAWPRGEEVAAGRRGTVMAHGDAHYMLMSPQPDEIVRLVNGTLTVQVEPLARGERFRVVTADGEVEVVGTAFDVTAEADRLVGVRVMHGVVRLKDAGGQIRVLEAGQVWRSAATREPVRFGPPAPDPVAAEEPVAPPVPRQIQKQIDPPPPAPGRSEGQKAFDDGWSALRANRFDEAAAAFARAAAAGAGTRVAEDASYWQAVALARAGQSAVATRAFESFLGLYPSSTRAGEASAMLGWILFDARDYHGAARRFRAAVKDPSARVRKSAADGLNAIRKAGQ
jgi:TolA-binding protein